MKERFTMLLFGMLLFVSVAGCNSGREKDDNGEEMIQESSSYEGRRRIT